MVVSSFSPVAWPAPTKKPANNNDTRSIVLREYVARVQGRRKSRRAYKSANNGSVHIAGFFAGENASNRMAFGLSNALACDSRRNEGKSASTSSHFTV